jgi:hypothetical protein
MAGPRTDLTTLVGELLAEEDADVSREGVRILAQAVMEAEVSAELGADDRGAAPSRLRLLLRGRRPGLPPPGGALLDLRPRAPVGDGGISTT